jgi:CheY-like chemotaxis protein
MKILVVEDDQDTQAILSELLQMQGHTIVTASESQQALAIIGHQPDIELLITDVSLPGMSGIELARAVKSSHPAIAILICSGYGEQQFETLAFPATWLQKPIEIDAFLEAIERFSGVKQ